MSDILDISSEKIRTFRNPKLSSFDNNGQKRGKNEGKIINHGKGMIFEV